MSAVFRLVSNEAKRKFTTIFRIALNVSSTRLILTTGEPTKTYIAGDGVDKDIYWSSDDKIMVYCDISPIGSTPYSDEFSSIFLYFIIFILLFVTQIVAFAQIE